MAIMPCTCKHPNQDAVNGPGMRAMSHTKSGSFRCSVCGKERGAGGGEAPKGKKK